MFQHLLKGSDVKREEGEVYMHATCELGGNRTLVLYKRSEMLSVVKN